MNCIEPDCDMPVAGRTLIGDMCDDHLASYLHYHPDERAFYYLDDLDRG